jgi:hypothetical protein
MVVHNDCISESTNNTCFLLKNIVPDFQLLKSIFRSTYPLFLLRNYNSFITAISENPWREFPLFSIKYLLKNIIERPHCNPIYVWLWLGGPPPGFAIINVAGIKAVRIGSKPN